MRHLSFHFVAHRWGRLCLWLMLVLLGFSWSALAEQRFPPPEFEVTNHQLPNTTTPAARANWLGYLDLAVLTAALGMATWIGYYKRSRKWVIGLSLFSLAYFGFYKLGCVCAIGSVQNVSLGLFDSSYAVPVVVTGFFVLPLAFALFAGRSFCSGVCPHGAIQDLVLVKPLKVPTWLEHGLGILPFIYLGAGVLFAATGSAFIICQYDPFVPIFRLSGRTLMVVTGVVLLGLGIFVGRPYCRFLCPFGALLKLGSLLSKRHVRVTPTLCTQCKLCEASCPFGALRSPEPEATPGELARDRRDLGWAILIFPALILAGVWLGIQFSPAASKVHPTVRLADDLMTQPETPPATTLDKPAQLELDRARQTPEPILMEAAKIRRKFEIGTPIFGGWIGLVIGAKWISLTLRRRRVDYEPDRGACVSCARCFETCPQEFIRRGIIPPEPQPVKAPVKKHEEREVVNV